MFALLSGLAGTAISVITRLELSGPGCARSQTGLYRSLWTNISITVQTCMGRDGICAGGIERTPYCFNRHNR